MKYLLVAGNELIIVAPDQMLCYSARTETQRIRREFQQKKQSKITRPADENCRILVSVVRNQSKRNRWTITIILRSRRN